ncbi:glycoside hydrolase family 30 protein [Trichoderma austrokoningii]
MRASLFASLAGQVAISAALPEPAQHSPRAAGAAAYASNSGGNYKLSSIAAPVQGAGSPGSESTWNLSIDDTSSGYKQKITGFGAAVTDATVASFNELSASTLSQLLDELMTSAGASFSLMRHTIGSSDLSADPVYTYDDNGGKADTAMTGFNLGDRGTAMAQMLAQMKGLNSNLKVFGSPWSPPAWMKLNNAIDGDTTNNNLNDGYLTNNGAQYSAAFAEYFVKYIQAYESHGATIDAITIQNEPLNSQSGYPTMYMFSYEQGDLIQNYVGPALKNAGLSTQIWAYDHNTDQPDFPEQVLGIASEYVPAVAWHCYATNLDWTVLTSFKNQFPNVEQYMTECWTPSTGSWNQASSFTIGPLQNWASGVAAWTLGTTAQDGPHLSEGGCATCTGLVTINNGEYTFQTAYYMMAQYSKFMPVGATVLSGTGSYTYSGSGGIQSVASLNPDGTRTVVIENTFGNDIYIHLTTQSGQEWSGNVPTESVTTWVLPAV